MLRRVPPLWPPDAGALGGVAGDAAAPPRIARHAATRLARGGPLVGRRDAAARVGCARARHRRRPGRAHRPARRRPRLVALRRPRTALAHRPSRFARRALRPDSQLRGGGSRASPRAKSSFQAFQARQLGGRRGGKGICTRTKGKSPGRTGAFTAWRERPGWDMSAARWPQFVSGSGQTSGRRDTKVTRFLSVFAPTPPCALGTHTGRKFLYVLCHT
mmetsp:Transcript_13240/g.44526  ORF Transcript_13240/g.44526 Transcript_13240/m.44526 type:complete len:217 (-) Transcript_13240:13-663(-)